MNKQGNILVQRIERFLANGTPNANFKWERQELYKSVMSARNKIIRARYFENLSLSQINGMPATWTPDDYLLSTYRNVPVLKDEDLCQYYSVLPAKILDLPDNISLYQISLMKGQAQAFIPMKAADISLYSESEALDLQGDIGYYIEGMRVYYVNIQPIQGIEKVLMKLINDAEVLRDDDAFISPDMEYDLINAVLQMYGQPNIMPENKNNN